MIHNSQYHKGVILFIAILFFSTKWTFGQAGLHVYAGTTSMTNALTEFTPEGLSHSGVHVGGDFVVNDGDMYFLLGLQLHSVDFIASNKQNYFDHQASLKIIKPKVGLGFNVLKFTDLFKLRLKIQASLDSFIESEEFSALNLNPALNGGTASGIGGIGINVGPARLDLEYHRGFINAFNEVKGSNFNYWLVNAGFFF